MPQERSAGAVIFRKEEGKIFYLLLHYKAKHWDFPKGHIEKGEGPEDAALREIKEETGIKDINFIKGFKQTIKYFYKKYGSQLVEKRATVLKIVVFFLAETQIKQIKISWEHEAFKWLPYKDALKQLTFSNAKKILQKANDFLQGKCL